MNLRQVELSFMLAGPTYQLNLPDWLPEVPTASCVVEFGSGGRECGFIPMRDVVLPFDADHWKELSTQKGANDIPVTVYEGLKDPKQWVLRWQLSNGDFRTHVRGTEGVDTAWLVVARLEVIDNLRGLPAVIPHYPLQRAISRRPGYQERISFGVTNPTSAEEGTGISLVRPGFLSPGQRSSSEDVGSGLHLRVLGLSSGIDMECVSALEYGLIDSILDAASNSMVAA